MDLFEGRRLVIATKHDKEKVVAPLLDKELGVNSFVPTIFNSDVFGTFSGEIQRENDPISTVRAKCLLAMEQTNCNLGVANEGSFGAHPTLYFAQADDEIMILIDKKNNIEVLVRELSTDTNFHGASLRTEDEFSSFLNQVQYPSHRVILRKSASDTNEVFKDFSNHDHLMQVFDSLMSRYGQVYAETDMRAMNNPSRMKVIELATKELIKSIKNVCPHCSIPGFNIKEVLKGLPCEWCNSPTESTLSYVYICQSCAYRKEEKYPHGKFKENPMYCNDCNP